MHKGLTIALALLLAGVCSGLAAQVYKVVDEDGNVTYTDQPPADGAGEVVVPELPVVQEEPEQESPSYAAPVDLGDAEVADETLSEEAPKSPRELRTMYRDFRIISPAPEESLWGTANAVVVSWGASSPYEEGMSVSVVVNGEAQSVDPNGNLSVTLDRGEHQVYAVLRDALGRRIVTTPTVTFFIHQASRLNNPG